MTEFKPLDKESVKLEGASLVEASAGTGKTYSIGLLVLRLILEKNIPVSRILLVTFTNAAVAELAARVRRFIREAIRAAETGKCNEETIQNYIAEQEDKQEVISRLKKALSELDEASIQTIHSFCQEALNEFALDSGQEFGLELQPGILGIAQDFINDFWRRNVAVLPVENLEEWGDDLSLQLFNDAVKDHLGGKEYAFGVDVRPEQYKEEMQAFLDSCTAREQELSGRVQQARISRFTDNHKEVLINQIRTNKQEFYEYLKQEIKGKPQYLRNCLEQLFEMERKEALALGQQHQNVVHTLISKCIREVKGKVEAYLHEKHLLTYDEIINRMHSEVLKEKKNSFSEHIRDRFDAVFIDEFQDTDKKQYEIYDKLFGEGKILFYIGDPKQSIYGWRKADLNTYFAARKKIGEDKLFRMNLNYRSSPEYVEAVNNFYAPVADPFKTGEGEAQEHIQYHDVEAFNGGLQSLRLEGREIKALEVLKENNKEKIKTKTLCLVQELLNGKYYLGKEKVKNSDIGILVRYNSEARELKDLLINAGFHTVTVDESKIFEDSVEAVALMNILEAILTTNEQNINKALLCEFTGFGYRDLAQIEMEDLLEKFRSYRETWVASGVYAAVRSFMEHFNVTRSLMESSNLRCLTNLTQILELLQEAEYRQELNPWGLYAYLQKQINGLSEEGDEFQQRIESDEEAIKILTIHKAKGLEYPIVIAPFLDLTAAEKFNFSSYRDAEGIYKFFPSKKGSAEMSGFCKAQLEQENRRLIYVALTRAKYNCFVFKSNANSALSDFTANVPKNTFSLPEKPLYSANQKPEISRTWGKSPEVDFCLADEDYGKLSFSALSAHGPHVSRNNFGEPQDEYDKFIFKEIPDGVTMGSMLHYLFENINFKGDREQILAEVDKLLDKYYPHKKDVLREGLVDMVEHVLEAEILIDGTRIPLKELNPVSMLNEMEFDYNTSGLDLEKLKNFDAGEGIEINCNMSIGTKQGLLNGLIDLFFEYQGKYYILDWKSNYLGDDLSYYEGGDQLREAMNVGNYHLQYFIYSVAAKKHLESRLENFSYEEQFGGAIYVYLRGARKGKQTGIYTNRPSLEQIIRMEQLFNKEELQPA